MVKIPRNTRDLFNEAARHNKSNMSREVRVLVEAYNKAYLAITGKKGG